MKLPNLRKKIKPTFFKNQSLRAILSPTTEAIEVLSIESIDYHVYNTKLIVLLIDESGLQEERICFYDRVHLSQIIEQDYNAPEYNIQAIIHDRNTRFGNDFTEEDIEIIDDYLVAIETSLGYIGDSGVRVIPPFAYQYWTSGLYPFHHTESMTAGVATLDSTLRDLVQYLPPEAFTHSISVLDGDLIQIRSDHDQFVEDKILFGMTALDGDLRQTLQRHDQPVEDALLASLVTLDGSLDTIRIVHDTQPIEAFGVTFVALDGDLQ